ncbi:hypothetical protein D0T88_24955 [Escherichia coli]|nr:hypothetical protein D0T88_24955 [Escherichia coli]
MNNTSPSIRPSLYAYTFSAAPASLTGARPAPGQFTATATITVEIVR